MKRITITPENQKAALNEAVEVLRAGGLVIFPTETMYGVAVNASSPEAVNRLLQFKNRPAGKPISVLVTDQKAAEQIAEVNEEAKKIYKTFLPGPVTVISTSKGGIDPRLQSEFGTIGIRISSYPLAQELIEKFNGYLTATSANSSGKARPYSIERMLSGLSESQKSLIDLVLDTGELPHNEPSTVIDTTGTIQSVVRAGALFDQVAPTLHSNSEEETINISTKLIQGFLHALPEKTVVFALEGDMGAGKTRFAKGVGAALGVKNPVNSPTYTLMKEYEGVYRTNPVRLLHMDLWRLQEVNPKELELNEYMQPHTVLVVEWAEPLLSFFAENKEKIVGHRISIDTLSENEREIKVGAL